MSNLLLDERVVAIQPSLVRSFGPGGAIVLQQIHYHLLSSVDGEVLDDEQRWVPLPYQEISDETGLTVKMVRTAVANLEAGGAIVSCQPEHWDRRKWYRIDYEHAAFAHPVPTAQTGRCIGPNGRLSSAHTGASPLSEEENSPLPPEGGEQELEAALAEALGWTPSTRAARRPWRRALRDLHDAAATPEQIHARTAVFRALWPTVACTAPGITKHWDLLGAHAAGMTVIAPDTPTGPRGELRCRVCDRPALGPTDTSPACECADPDLVLVHPAA